MGRHFSGDEGTRRGCSHSRTSAPTPRSGAPAHGTARGMSTRQLSERSARALSPTSRGGSAHARRGSGGRGGRGGRGRIAMAVVAGVVVLAAAAFALLSCNRGQGSQESATVTVSIPEGSGASQIAQILADAEVIDDTSAFTSAVQEQGAENSLKSGTYKLATHSSADDVIAQLIEGPNTTDNQLTIPEGLTVAQTAARVQDALGISSDDFLAQAKASNYVDDYPFLADSQDDSLEGFLCPKTYDFSGKDVTADTVIRAMLDQYEAEVASLDFATAEASIKSTYGVDMSDYDIIVMASIIEREAVTADDRPLVSSVFYNRLAAGMDLQSDATMAYVTGGEVTADDLKTESPYNTYLNAGLTPTPICSPSLASIQAALSPASTDYYYFYIVEDGTRSVHAFSETYEQHQQVIAENS